MSVRYTGCFGEDAQVVSKTTGHQHLHITAPLTRLWCMTVVFPVTALCSPGPISVRCQMSY